MEKNMMAKGWNTWNVRSVLSHVHLPEGFAISLGFKTYTNGCCLREALIGRKEKHSEVIIPGPHAYDASYTSLELAWGGLKVRVETAVEDDEWFARVTPLNTMVKTPALTIEGAVLWGRPGYARRDGTGLLIENGEKSLAVHTTGVLRNDEPVVEITSPYLLVALEGPVCIATNAGKLSAASEIIERKKKAFVASRKGEGQQQEVYDAMQICLAWDTIYDPFNDRVISPVSRIWSCSWGGWVLFDWDTYFAAWMASVENKELAYANAIAITDEVTEKGFIPNFATPSGFKSRDRSQPPVGALTVRAICDRVGETVLAEKLFDVLLGWNRWWPEHRDQDGYLCWGSNPYEPVTGCGYETLPLNTRFASALESGLDNSPMYKDIPYDAQRNLMQLADVGLMSFYITDCRELAELARRIGRNEVVGELNGRADKYAAKLKTLWCEKTGLFLNKRLDTGEFQTRLSPTHFYPLLAKVATPSQAQRMIDEHFFNPQEFWGEWILPSISRNDELYPDQDYWRGRIWAPMNFLVYLGLCNYDLPQARQALVAKSEALLLKEWREKGHVHENYCADTGAGCGKESSDAFYHWGGLLGLISVMEQEQGCK
jgi:putative isomerase